MAVVRNDWELSFGNAVRYSAVGGCYVCAYDPSDWCDVCAYGLSGWCDVWTQGLGYGQALMLADAGGN